MSKQKDFRDLFGCDDSDEENLQTKSSSSVIEKNKKLIEIKNDQSNTRHGLRDKTDISKHIHYKNGIEPSKLDNGKRVNNAYELDNKRIKKQHVQEFDKRIHESITNSIKDHKINNPAETDSSQNLKVKQKVTLKKTEVGGLVVKLLTPAYVEKRFDSRDTFKKLARNISHALYDKGKHINSNYCFISAFIFLDDQEIRQYIKNFLNRNEEFTSHTTL